jgi:hypothetical protein
MGELSPDKDPHPREAHFGAVRRSDLLGAGRAQVLIWLRGLNLNLQIVASSGIDIRALLIVGSRSHQIWEDSERRMASTMAGTLARRSWALLSRLHLSRRHLYRRLRLRQGTPPGGARFRHAAVGQGASAAWI